MRFIDEVSIKISSGKGGNGCVGFRREKFVAYGGPDGGDGGDGGDVYFVGNEGLNTLAKFRGIKTFKAQNGEDGKGSRCNGANGEDLFIQVPIGTLIKNAENDFLLADITQNQEPVLLAQGGRGGLGNYNFKSSTNQAPRHATDGKEGVEIDLQLELKLLADIALIGLPNAGKSTLISVLSAAKPKIADYPFTTLEPNLGVVAIDDETSFVLADIPGLVENAAEGKGLGHKFLKHIERTKAFVHLVDISWCIEEYEAFEQYVTIRDELEKYNLDLLSKKEIICLTKIDALTLKEIKKYQDYFEENLGKKVLPLSSVKQENLDILTQLMIKVLQEEEA